MNKEQEESKEQENLSRGGNNSSSREHTISGTAETAASSVGPL